jgi:hypothetical protein
MILTGKTHRILARVKRSFVKRRFVKYTTVGLFAVALAASLVCAGAAQQVETTPIPQLPKPDLSSMTFLVGSWNCTFKSARRATPSTATGTFALDPSGYWLVESWKSPAVAWYPHPTSGTDRITYDATTKRWVDIETDDNGGYDLSVSRGWNGNEIVWHDVTYTKGADLESNNDTTETKVSDSKTATKTSFKTTKGRVVGVTGSCTKI